MMVEFVFIMFDEIVFDLLLLCWHFLETALVLCLLLIVMLCHTVSYEGRRRKVARVHLTLFHFMDTKYEDLNIEIIAKESVRYIVYSFHFKIIYHSEKTSRLFLDFAYLALHSEKRLKDVENIS